MSWQTKIELQVFDARNIGANLLKWFGENQADALLWANDGLPILGTKNILIQDFFPNARIAARFPVLMVNQAVFDSETGEDIAVVSAVLEYEIALMNGKQDWLARYAPVYAMAFESMLKNIPKTRLEKDSKIDFDGQLTKIETAFDLLKTNGNNFLQTFTTQVSWTINFSNYE